MNLKKRVEELEREVERLKRMWEEHMKICPLFQKRETPSFVKENINHRHKKSGQKNGHEGYTRYIPERIDEVKKLTLNKCPHCGGKLSKTQEIRERVVTDVPEVKATNTKYIIPRKFCKRCKKLVEPEVKDALPNARFGLKLMLLIMFLKIGIRIPSNKIIEILNLQYGIKISDGEIYCTLEQLSKAFGPYYEELKQKMRDAAVKYIDETGWRMNGKNYWLWHFINKEISLYIVEKKRNGNVPIKLLGNQKGKIGVRDRHSAYNQLAKETGMLQQLCWAHLLRNSKDLAEHYNEAKYIHKRLKWIYKSAVNGESKEKLLHWVDLIAYRTYIHSEVFKFVKSLYRTHRDSLFRFVDNPEVESTNNRAERGLRHAVVMRKISNGNRSEKGAEVTGRLLSVIKSLELQNINPLTGGIDLLQNTK